MLPPTIEGDAPLHGADAVKVLIEFLPVRMPQLPLQPPGIFGHQVQNTVVLSQPSAAPGRLR